MRTIKTYRCISKIGNNPNGSAQCVKHHTNNLLSYTNYLDMNHPDWRWFNVFDKESGLQLASFQKKNRPMTKQL